MLLNFKCKQILLKQGLLFVNEVIKILVNVFLDVFLKSKDIMIIDSPLREEKVTTSELHGGTCQ